MKQSKVDILIDKLDPTKFYCSVCKKYKKKVGQYYIRVVTGEAICYDCGVYSK